MERTVGGKYLVARSEADPSVQFIWLLILIILRSSPSRSRIVKQSIRSCFTRQNCTIVFKEEVAFLA
ncbi:hypothetical protein QN277_001696 [Acacia crassicarpa]|uniref:Uncharacterized protein n=1 Tax=Acacia crassicarpa TaxID=499986 RepID=A0AAE1TIN2_9FABA|nr:hypothetical protein QN277_001696 [Acacia crassicarpa]